MRAVETAAVESVVGAAADTVAAPELESSVSSRPRTSADITPKLDWADA